MAHNLIGCTGTVIVATRGDDGVGEVSLSVRGGSESYLAWSPLPLPRGTPVIVTDSRGPRTVEVESLEVLDIDPHAARGDEPPDVDPDPDPDPPNLLAL